MEQSVDEPVSPGSIVNAESNVKTDRLVVFISGRHSRCLTINGEQRPQLALFPALSIPLKSRVI